SGPTATLVGTVPEKSQLFVYVPRLGFAIGVKDGAIPADTDVVPLILRDGNIVAVGARTNVPAGRRATADFTPPQQDHADVIAPIIIAKESNLSGAPPEITIADAQPVASIAKGQSAALLIFRDVPAASKLVISGPRWATIERPINAKSGEVVTLDPITAKPTTKLIVNWWAPVDPSMLVKRDDAPCKRKPSAFDMQRRSTEKTFVAILNACESPRRCREYARRELTSGVKGMTTFEKVPAGLYSLDLSYPQLPIVSNGFEVAPNETTSMDFELKYITFFGTITRGGKPLHALIWGATSDANTGDYTAVVTRLPGKGSAELMPCDTNEVYRFVLDEAPKENTAFDIDVPDNRIKVEVHDADSGQPIAKAKFWFGADNPDHENGMHFSASSLTDDNGTGTISPVLKNRKIKVCATPQGYESKCETDFMMDVEEKTVRFDLHKVEEHRGRVDAGGPFTRGILVWVSPQASTITEMIRDFNPDGSFTYQKQHPPGEVVVFTAADKPLFAFLQPPNVDDPFIIALPPAPVRAFDVSLSETSKEPYAAITLRIGGVPVPIDAFNWHIASRGQIAGVIHRGSTIHVADILATGPVEVILVPSTMIVSRGEVPFVPEAASFPRQELGTNNAIMFP
ncbi:MAG TPA: hypothetical protein VJ853_14415, partial [Thermoanaerobaculia bacterium]|nr:hypothetical protein [Thermoanaerobaculia bacterium]